MGVRIVNPDGTTTPLSLMLLLLLLLGPDLLPWTLPHYMLWPYRPYRPYQPHNLIRSIPCGAAGHPGDISHLTESIVKEKPLRCYQIHANPERGRSRDLGFR